MNFKLVPVDAVLIYSGLLIVILGLACQVLPVAAFGDVLILLALPLQRLRFARERETRLQAQMARLGGVRFLRDEEHHHGSTNERKGDPYLTSKEVFGSMFNAPLPRPYYLVSLFFASLAAALCFAMALLILDRGQLLPAGFCGAMGMLNTLRAVTLRCRS